MSRHGWVGFDLDGTLAHYEHGQTVDIGKPVPAMVEILKEHVDQGFVVKVMTARASLRSPAVNQAIYDWCQRHLGFMVPVTCEKDFNMIRLYDDRAIAVEENTGRILGGKGIL